MKKLYTFNLLLICLLFFSTFNGYAQEMLVGGNMESGDSWSTSQLDQDPDNAVTFDYGYTTDKPSAGEGGCLHINGTNTGTTGGNLTNFMFYQQVTLQCDSAYTFDLAYKDIRTDNYWFEVYYGGNEPADGADYGGDEVVVFLGGFKSHNWEDSCASDVIDGTFLNDACIPDGDTLNPIIIEGSGDTTVYIGFRFGIWDGDANGFTFELFIDNVSLMGPDTNGTSIINHLSNINIYPSQMQNELCIQLTSKIKNVQIVNLLGQTVITYNNLNTEKATLDVSGITPGLYYVVISDINNRIGTAKAYKL